MLQRLQLQGIKSLLDLAVDLEPFTVLVGPNGCGKSTLLDQIDLLCQMTSRSGPSTHVLGPAGDVLEAWVGLGERTRGAGRTQWSGTAAAGTSFCATIDWPQKGHWSESAQLSATGPGFSAAQRRSGSSAAPDLSELLQSQFNWRAQRLALSPQHLALASPVTLTALEPTGYGLPTVLKDMAPEHTTHYLAMQEDMRKVVPAFRGLRLGKATGPGQEPLTTLEIEMVQGRFPAHQVSDGTRIALALLTVVHHPELPKIVLIDDIDHGLHLGAQYQMIQAIRAVQKERPELQVICTAHSPYMLDSLRSEEVHVMNLDRAGHAVARRLTEAPDFARWSRGLHAGEIG